MLPSHATAVDAASGTDDEPVERATQTPESVPNDVVDVSSRPNSSAFVDSVTPRLARKHIGTTRDIPSASKSEMTVDKLIGSRVLHSVTSDEDDALDTNVARTTKAHVCDGKRILFYLMLRSRNAAAAISASKEQQKQKQYSSAAAAVMVLVQWKYY